MFTRLILAALLAVSGLAHAQWPGYVTRGIGVSAIGATVSGGTAGSNLVVGATGLAEGGQSMTSDAAATSILHKSFNAYPQATVNTGGANTILAGGIGRRIVTVVDYSLIDAGVDTITLTINGTANIGTEGTQDATHWKAQTSNAVTATNICTWAAQLSGVLSASAASGVCYVTPAVSTYAMTLATSMAAGEGTVTSGANGTTSIYDPNSATAVFTVAAALVTAEQRVDINPAGSNAYLGLFGSSTETGALRSRTDILSFQLSVNSALTTYDLLLQSGTSAAVKLGTTSATVLTVGASSITAAQPLYMGSQVVANGATGGTLAFSATAGAGPTLAGGTATTDVAALSVTRTNNNAAVETGVKVTFTDASSSASFKPLEILCGTGAATNCFTVDKSGNTSSAGANVTFTTGTARTIATGSEIIVCTGTCTVTPPATGATIAGMQFCIQNDDNIATVITIAAVASVQYELPARTSYKAANTSLVSNGAVLNQICMVAVSATKWNVFSSVGTWS